MAAFDLLTVDRHDRVAGMKSGAGRGPGWINLRDSSALHVRIAFVEKHSQPGSIASERWWCHVDRQSLPASLDHDGHSPAPVTGQIGVELAGIIDGVSVDGNDSVILLEAGPGRDPIFFEAPDLQPPGALCFPFDPPTPPPPPRPFCPP